MPAEWQAAWAALNLIGMPLFLLFALHKRWIVIGSEHAQLEQRCARQEAQLDALHGLLLEQSSLVRQSVTVAEQVVTRQREAA